MQGPACPLQLRTSLRKETNLSRVFPFTCFLQKPVLDHSTAQDSTALCDQ